MSLNEFFQMGGYGVYVWTTYGITFFVFSLNVMSVFVEKRAIKKMVERYFERSARPNELNVPHLNLTK